MTDPKTVTVQERPSAVQFISPDDTWDIVWRYASRDRRFGALLMVKWRAFGIGLEWFGFNWLGVFFGPFCFAFGKIELTQLNGGRNVG